VSEFDQIARQFIREHLSFLDRNWLYDVLDQKLAKLLERVVKEHTSTTSNTALRKVVREGAMWAEDALRLLPTQSKKCRCQELDDGEHKPQPLCHYCLLGMLATQLKLAESE